MVRSPAPLPRASGSPPTCPKGRKALLWPQGLCAQPLQGHCACHRAVVAIPSQWSQDVRGSRDSGQPWRGAGGGGAALWWGFLLLWHLGPRGGQDRLLAPCLDPRQSVLPWGPSLPPSQAACTAQAGDPRGGGPAAWPSPQQSWSSGLGHSAQPEKLRVSLLKESGNFLS